MAKTQRVEGNEAIEYTNINQRAYTKRYGKSVQSNRKRYKLTFCKHLKLHGNAVQGLCVPTLQEIFVDVDGSCDITSTVCHEIIHADFAEGGIRQMSCWSPDLEELVCEIVGESLAHNFKLIPKN